MEESAVNKSQQVGFGEQSSNGQQGTDLGEQSSKTEQDVNLEEELQDPETQQPKEITWTGRPAVTLIRHWKCPHCGSYDTLKLTQTLMTDPMQYQYECSNCHKTFITREAITSIVYVNAEYYEKEKEATGTGLVEGKVEYR